MTTTCKNCNQRVEGNFCSNCGQSSHTHDINFSYVIHEIQHSILHVDKGIFYTIKELFYRPGHSIREYIEGKRVSHFKPITFVIILSTIYALLNRVGHDSTILESMMQGFASASDTEEEKRKFSFINDAIEWSKDHYAYATLLLIPVSSLASYLAFIRTKYNYFQHLILNSFVEGQRTVAFLLFLPLTYFITNEKILGFLSGLKAIIGILLVFWTYNQFFNKKGLILKIFLTLLTYIIWLVIVGSLMALYIKISKLIG